MTKRPSRGVTSGIGPPTKMDGRDGDLTIRKTRDGKILYNGIWREEGWEQFPWEKLAYKVGTKAKKEAEKKNT